MLQNEVNSIKIFDRVDVKSQILLSIVIPTFSRPETLIDTIDSIERNKIDCEYQIVVVDNSADFSVGNRTKNLLERYTNLPIVYYINEKNLGMEGNWNRGIDLAKGEYICLIHDDDMISDKYWNNTKKIIHILNNEKRCMFCKIAYEIFTDKNEIKENTENSKKYLYKYSRVKTLVDGVTAMYTPSCGMLIKKEMFKNIGDYDSSFHPCSDNEIGVRVLEKHYYGYTTSWPMGLYRIGVNESMKKETILGFISKDCIIRKRVYGQTLLSKLFGCLFEKYYYSARIDFWIKYAKDKFGKTFTINDLDIYNSYRKYRKRPLVLRVLSRINILLCKKIYI